MVLRAALKPVPEPAWCASGMLLKLLSPAVSACLIFTTRFMYGLLLEILFGVRGTDGFQHLRARSSLLRLTLVMSCMMTGYMLAFLL